jgi:hypothetical protein
MEKTSMGTTKHSKNILDKAWIFSLAIVIITSSCSIFGSNTNSKDNGGAVSTVMVQALPTEGISTPTKIQIPTPTNTPVPPLKMSIKNQYEQVYGIPDLGFAIRKDIRAEDTYSVLGRSVDNTFLAIQYSDSKKGWIPASDVIFSISDGINTLPIVPFTPPVADLVNWKGTPVQTICLDVHSNYIGEFTKSHPKDEPRPYNPATITALLHYLGVTVVASGEKCDATLQIDYIIDQIGYRYTSQQFHTTETCYTGLHLMTQWSLSQGDIVQKAVEKMNRSGQQSLFGCPEISTYEDEETYTAIIALNKLWGEAIYKPLSIIINTPSNKYIIDAATKLGKKGTAFIPYLIPLVNDSLAGNDAQNVLNKISGQQFEGDESAWQAWYVRQLTLTPATP